MLLFARAAHSEWKCASLCASSLSWCGNLRSSPPLWMSICAPMMLLAIALHSMCQPGVKEPFSIQQRDQLPVHCRRISAGTGGLGHSHALAKAVLAAGCRHIAQRGCGLCKRDSPGRPLPQGLSQKGSPGLAAFHRAKSCV